MENNELTLMLVHAHPDDESIGTGGILAKYGAEGVRTVLVTCTGGELGDIQNSEFVPPKPGMPMTDIRKIEMATALSVLGVAKYYRLGYRDSGMAGTPGNKDPRCFAKADVNEASRRLMDIMRAEKPHVVVTYDETGIYWHPDHVMAHKITQKAFFDAVDASKSLENQTPVWRPAKLYHIAIPMERIRRYRQSDGEGDSGEQPPSTIVGTPDEKITTRVDITKYLDQKFKAIFSHSSQISADHLFRRADLSQREALFGHEHFVCAFGCAPRPGGQKETDLFEGLRNETVSSL